MHAPATYVGQSKVVHNILGWDEGIWMVTWSVVDVLGGRHSVIHGSQEGMSGSGAVGLELEAEIAILFISSFQELTIHQKRITTVQERALQISHNEELSSSVMEMDAVEGKDSDA
ncbi:hypothetical protein BDQ12DRAFT_671628 [Crucibulum laeve]|uniref:Uncharacterized protein n=1 Tax=Crucibulum laeve TaxID=68775 RepID=A0A5C3LHS6_9AGAR|nr:hypothetical protein BDQ12DRAFT_671628 [Crucibulum laeve]